MNNPVLPTIAELANKTKVSTSQVCLRIKDSTKEFFERQAATYASTDSESSSTNKISANSLMTTLLDSYAENYTLQHTNMQHSVEEMRKYLHHQAHLISRSTDDRLLYRIFKPGFKDGYGDTEFQFCLEDYNNINELCDRYHHLEQGVQDEGYINDNIYYEVNGGTRVEIHCVSPDIAEATYAPSDKDEPYMYYGIVGVPISKWLICIAMIDAYIKKVKELTSDTNAGFSIDAMQELVTLINQTSREDLAFKLADFLVDYMEQAYA